MPFTLIAGSANPRLAAAVSAAAGAPLGRAAIHRFPDGELHVALGDSVRGQDVYLLQPTAPPVESHAFELLLLADAARRAGAARITGVVPYLGYARQDRRAGGREALGARIMADLLGTGLDRVVAVDLHMPALEGFFSIPIEHLTAVTALAERIGASTANGVVVAPDLGAARLADRYARALDLPVAMVLKTRLDGAEVVARGVTGEVRGRAPLIVDDMISTGATVIAAAEAVIEAGASPEVTVVATHALLVGDAVPRLERLGLRRLMVTDSVQIPAHRSLPLEVVSIAPLLGEVINRLHRDRSLADVLVHG
ncbi:MAG TPA: ribose-phosphate diphosphokinase [Gemmatimonadales bacterium]|nr:ribose-phosphate diphosphokinase [Gemmatimonadales bacterium]